MNRQQVKQIREDLSKSELIELYKLIREKRIREARTSLWDYCTLVDGGFYQEHRWHLKLFCDTLQDLYEKKLFKNGKLIRKLMINMPPRLGKSRTLIHFCEWVLGKNINNKIMTLSYSDDLAHDFSRYTRDAIMTKKNRSYDVDYSDIFPNTRMKDGNASLGQWAVDGSFFSYKGAGIYASLTGKGCNIMIADDLVKDDLTANNPNELEKLNRAYNATAITRQEEDGIEIMCATRWSDLDPCGKILSSDEAEEWEVLCLPAVDKHNNLLCPDLLSEERLQKLFSRMPKDTYYANFMQKPTTNTNPLYVFRTYDTVQTPKLNQFSKIQLFLDIARKGKDYLSAVCVIKEDGYSYILDWYHSQANTDITIPELANFIMQNRVKSCRFENNNGGDDYSKLLDQELRKNQYYECRMIGFDQHDNKEAKISIYSHIVNTSILFPSDHETRFKKAIEQMKNYKKGITNQSDDAPDIISEVAKVNHPYRNVILNDDIIKKEQDCKFSTIRNQLAM